ncbi:hypothetical protein [Rhodococcus aetherivorans]|uniref:hypothetical protein n=1 Tax=Rhodococcus aetherivorans TaxID=191292 RepID=UPI00241FEBB1|nr:hypothetical protein [Rhodococcus aetherivorans]WFS13811.1 hypothetical protein P9K37_01440 [Rhodococcus aetherivorans]
MTEIDPRVARLNASIQGRLSRYEGDRKHISDAAVHADHQRKWMREHQPEGGQWGAPCMGDHEQSTPWPCQQMQNFDSPMAYMD